MAQFVLSQHDTQQRLAAAGIGSARAVTVRTDGEIREAMTSLRTPVVLKASGLVHKSDSGGVVLGLADPRAVIAAVAELTSRLGPEAAPFMLQEQVEGLEILVGARRHPRLGVALVVGHGGTRTELHRDLYTAMAPVDKEQALRMLQRLRCWPLLEGFRGEPPRDVDALVRTAVALSRLVTESQDIIEVDLNPVMVGEAGQGATVVDARFVCDGETVTGRRPRPGLDRMLRPAHVAVVGVSDDKDKAGAKLFRYLHEHGFPGRLDAVHPTGGQIDGDTRARSLAELSGSPDLVCVAVPSRHVLEIARQAADMRVGGVIVHSADFAETGAAGRAVQDALATTLADAGIPLVGPNSMGVVAPHDRLMASISSMAERPARSGAAALLTSSGALGSCLASRLNGSSIGLSYWIHAGNEADVVIADYLDWLVDDDATSTVGLVLEDIKDGPRFIEAGRRMSKAGRSMFAYCMARSRKGRDAVLSHTGAMVGDIEMREAVLRAAGVVSVPSLLVLEDAIALSTGSPRPRGRRLAGITFSGGACTIIADICDEEGIELPELPDEVRSVLTAALPEYAAIRNPLDVSYQLLGKAENFETAVEVIATSGAFDAVLIQFTTNADPHAERLARKLVSLLGRVDIPIYVSRYGANHLAPMAMQVYREAGVYVMEAPDRACRAISALMRAREPEETATDA
ncbi:acetate--CoA ligase family protein [Actinophytocola sp.]|uniref:acetate--CoA ligase family protein n=1 Tax=Actinophytocola sp. TaxID=1872138 RepID=UPI003D6AAE14